MLSIYSENIIKCLQNRGERYKDGNENSAVTNHQCSRETTEVLLKDFGDVLYLIDDLPKCAYVKRLFDVTAATHCRCQLFQRW